MTAEPRQYFKVEKYRDEPISGLYGDAYWRIVSVAGGDTVAESIPAEDLAQIMCEAANNARSKKK